MNKFLQIYLILFCASSLIAQEGNSFKPKNLGIGVNSSYDEFNPVLSPDGKTLYFVRANHPENKYGAFDSQDIWYSEWLDSTWTTATRLKELNIGRYNAVLSVLDEGNTLLLNGVFNKQGTFWRKRGLSTATRSGDSWAPPVKVDIKKIHRISDGLIGGAFMTNDRKIIVFNIHRIYNSKQSDIFISEIKENGKYKRPKKIYYLSTGGHTSAAPFISADGTTIYISSDDAAKGLFEIYSSTRDPNDSEEWSQPTKLKGNINSNGWDSYFKTNEAGSVAYFSSTNKSVGGSDIFKIKLIEENPFVIVSGKVVNGKTGLPIKKNFSILANGLVPDSLKMNQDSSTFKIQLPLGEKYSMQSLVQNYTSVKSDIDVSNVKEFMTLKKDLMVLPLPYVKVSGKLLDRSSNTIISPSHNPIILLDNATSDSIKYDKQTGIYSLNINHGQKYSLLPKADKHESVAAPLDLTAINEYQEINLDLFLESEKLVTVTGIVMDKNSSKPFAPASKINVVFTGPSPVAATIDTLTSKYEVRLQPGSSYAISASAPNCVPVYESIDLTNASRGATVNRDLTLATIEVGQAVRLNNIFFESGKAVLKKESFPELDRVYDFLKQNEAIKVEIAGHTDNVGNAAFNQTLSKARAEAVAAYVIKKGIAKERLQAQGYGMTKPVATNATKEGKAQNRRVEFMVLGK
jgi:outer membrane protein OmpA-like peptidoglycan-associated protein